jgi:hypothetical protein
MLNSSDEMKCIYARPILAGVGNAIRHYCERLAADTQFTTKRKTEWGKALRKLDAIAVGCGVLYNDLGNPVWLKGNSPVIRHH